MSHTDIALTHLPRMDQSLLWAIRIWVTGRRAGGDMGARIVLVFRHIGVPDAAQPLEGFLWVLSQGLTRCLKVNCTCQTTVSPDGARLLALFALLREDRVEDAEALLREVASERVALLASDCALRVALLFRAAVSAPADEGRPPWGGVVVPLRRAGMLH